MDVVFISPFLSTRNHESKPHMKQPCILVVEDDDDIRTVLMDQLVLDDYTAIGASTGKEVMRLFKEQEPDLVILDLKLPDVDGLIICQHLRQISNVPIIIVSARDTLPDKIRGLEVGADDYVTKPFEYLELKARINACLRRRRDNLAVDEEIIRLGELEVFREQRKVSVKGRTARLTRKEFELLDIFMENQGKVLTREFLTSKLWNEKEVYPWSRALDVHVRRLRKKIEPDPANPRFIITHSGMGYRFSVD